MEENKKKILILYNKLFHYRIPIFNILAQKYDLTVSYSYKPSDGDLEKCNFKTHYLPIKKRGSFYFHKDNLLEYCNQFEAIIAYGQVTWLSVSNLARHKKRQFKIAYWGIGVAANYDRKYDDGNFLLDIFRDFFYKKADGQIFYTEYPIAKYVQRGYKREKLFVANNTVAVERFDNRNSTDKNSLLFIGTLYMEKGLLILLESYKSAYEQTSLVPNLNIVGAGEQFGAVKKWVIDHKLQDKIHLLGAIYDINIKSDIFRRSLACISPNQAGLSVLESMGYGVPFITHKDAITGGEAFNITNEVTGLRLDNLDNLTEVILDITYNPEKYIEMGKRAYNHYWSCRKPEDMARELFNLVEFMINNYK